MVALVADSPAEKVALQNADEDVSEHQMGSLSPHERGARVGQCRAGQAQQKQQHQKDFVSRGIHCISLKSSDVISIPQRLLKLLSIRQRFAHLLGKVVGEFVGGDSDRFAEILERVFRNHLVLGFAK